MEMRRINNGQDAREVREVINANFDSLNSGKLDKVATGGVLTSRILSSDDYTFDPKSIIKYHTISSPAFNQIPPGVNANGFTLVDRMYGAMISGNSGFINTGTPVTIAAILHRDLNSGRTFAIPTDMDAIHRVTFTVFNESFSPTTAEGTILSIEPFTTNEGFGTYRINGVFEAVFASSVNVVEFSLYIGAMPTRENDSAVTSPTIQGVATSRILFRHASGNNSIFVNQLNLDVNAATNRFVSGRAHHLFFDAPIRDTDTISLHADITTKLSGFPPELGFGDGMITIKHGIDSAGVVIGRSTAIPTTANIELLVQGVVGESINFPGFATVALSRDGIVIGTGANDLGGVGYPMYAMMATEIAVEFEICKLEVISRSDEGARAQEV